jgi:hypothetical protein
MALPLKLMLTISSVRCLLIVQVSHLVRCPLQVQANLPAKHQANHPPKSQEMDPLLPHEQVLNRLPAPNRCLELPHQELLPHQVVVKSLHQELLPHQVVVKSLHEERLPLRVVARNLYQQELLPRQVMVKSQHQELLPLQVAARNLHQEPTPGTYTRNLHQEPTPLQVAARNLHPDLGLLRRQRPLRQLHRQCRPWLQGRRAKTHMESS